MSIAAKAEVWQLVKIIKNIAEHGLQFWYGKAKLDSNSWWSFSYLLVETLFTLNSAYCTILFMT
jgi:hypothetical protein